MKEWNKKNNERLAAIIGESVKGRRLQKNISQGELSELSGVSKASITRFETGNHTRNIRYAK